MRFSRMLALGVVLGSSRAAAQSATADGVQALLRGDYQTAARILTPLAEQTPQPDPIAQFFLAALYASDQNAPRNHFRACGLFVSAASAPNPLMPQALEIADAIQEPFARASAREALCAPANVYPWGEAPPASFTLAPGHWVRIDAGSTTIGFDGAEHRTGGSRFGAGIVYLPIQYTPLDVSRPDRARRHFIQSFIWHHNGPGEPQIWSLGWFLDEVVGAEMHMVATDPRLITITAPQPPPIDTSQAVVVRVNADGDAEWAVGDPSSPRGGVIPFRERR